METTNYVALFGYLCIFMNRFRYMAISKFNMNLTILVTGLFAFIVYYFNEIRDETDYCTQLRTRQLAHVLFIIYILATFMITRNVRLYYVVALVAHSLFLYNISTNTNQLMAYVSMSVYFAMIFANTIKGDYSIVLVIGQVLLFVFYSIGAYKTYALDKINHNIVKCPVVSADKTDTMQELVKQE